MTTVQLWTFVIIPAIAVLSVIGSAVAGYLKDRDAESGKAEAKKKVHELNDTLAAVRAEAATNHKSLTDELNRSRQETVAVANSLADVTIANENLRAELKRQLLVKNADATSSVTTLMEVNPQQDEQIFKTFARHAPALKARLDDARRIEAEETVALQKAADLDRKLRSKLQVAFDAAVNALRRTSELGHLPISEMKVASFPDRTMLTSHELATGTRGSNLNVGQFVTAKLTTGEVIIIEILAGYVKSPRELHAKSNFGGRDYDQTPDVLALPQIHFQCQMAQGNPVTWQIRFNQETGELLLSGDVPEEAKSGDDGARVFAYVVNRLAAYRLEMASTRAQ